MTGGGGGEGGLFSYGEGWSFGEIAGDRRGVNACQHNLAGTGIGRYGTDFGSDRWHGGRLSHRLSLALCDCGGSFNDRIRDTAMGGSPFGDPQQQGFLTGLSLQVQRIGYDANEGCKERVVGSLGAKYQSEVSSHHPPVRYHCRKVLKRGW